MRPASPSLPSTQHSVLASLHSPHLAVLGLVTRIGVASASVRAETFPRKRKKGARQDRPEPGNKTPMTFRPTLSGAAGSGGSGCRRRRTLTFQELKEIPHLRSPLGLPDLEDKYFSQDPTCMVRLLPLPCCHLPLKCSQNGRSPKPAARACGPAGFPFSVSAAVTDLEAERPSEVLGPRVAAIEHV